MASMEGEVNAVILRMQDAKGSRDFSGDLTRQQGGSSCALPAAMRG